MSEQEFSEKTLIKKIICKYIKIRTDCWRCMFWILWVCLACSFSATEHSLGWNPSPVKARGIFPVTMDLGISSPCSVPKYQAQVPSCWSGKEVARPADTLPGSRGLQNPRMGNGEEMMKVWRGTTRACRNFFFPQSVIRCATKSLLGLQPAIERHALKMVHMSAGAFSVSGRVYFICLDCQQI